MADSRAGDEADGRVLLLRELESVAMVGVGEVELDPDAEGADAEGEAADAVALVTEAGAGRGERNSEENMATQTCNFKLEVAMIVLCA